jgi:catecholate siderophore receptor
MHPLTLAIALALSNPADAPADTVEASPVAAAQAGSDPVPGPAVSAADDQGTVPLPSVDVVEFRGQSVSGVKYTRPVQDIPRIITVLPSALLEEKGVDSLADAMRNVPGISLQAGEGNPPGGDQLKIRGFNARDDINVNGTRDIGNYFRDPFYVEQVEIVKGPNSAYSGRGSAGGTINFVTKQPLAQARTQFDLSAGTDDYQRFTADINRPLDGNSAVRVNLMGHSASLPGRDIAEDKRYGVYAAYNWGMQGDTLVQADVLHTQQENLPDAGLPFDRDPRGANSRGTGRLPPDLDFDNFYGHINDYKDVEVTQFGLGIEHAFGNGVRLRNQTRLGRVHNDNITSSPRIRNVPATSPNFEGAQVRGDTKPRDQTDEAFTNQTALVLGFDTGGIRHDLVTGVDVGRFDYENRRRTESGGPLTDLYDPQPRNLPATPYDGTVYRFQTREVGIYALDTLALSPQWDLNLGVRWDRVEATASEHGRENLPVPGDNRRLSREDEAVSGSVGVVYKATPNLSLYASAGTAFEVSGNFDRNQVNLGGGPTSRVADAPTFQIEPEKTTAFEAGAKWRVGDSLDLNAALFETRKEDARFPAQAAGDNSILDAELRIRGFELLAAGSITPEWRLYSGYAYLDSEVLAAPSRPFAVGQTLGGTPEHSFTLFTQYDFTPALTLGGGVQHVGRQFGSVQATATGTRKVEVPSYTVFDLYAAYRFTPALSLRLNLFNADDERYVAEIAEGGGQGIPGPGRQWVATLRYRY